MKTPMKTLSKTLQSIDTNVKCNPRIVFLIITITSTIMSVLYDTFTLRIFNLPGELKFLMVVVYIIQILLIMFFSYVLKLFCKNNYSVVAWIFAIVMSFLLLGPGVALMPEFASYRVDATRNTTITRELMISSMPLQVTAAEKKPNTIGGGSDVPPNNNPSITIS